MPEKSGALQIIPTDLQDKALQRLNKRFELSEDRSTKLEDKLAALAAEQAAAPSGGTAGAVLLETNGSKNGSQAKLNLIAGSNVTLTDDGAGDVTIAAAGGGGGGGGGGGTVTHTGSLTSDDPVFGNGTADIKVGTKSGNTNELATVSGALPSGHMVVADASGNLVDGGAAPAEPSPAAATPLVESGAGAVGVSANYAREDHVHPAVTVPVPSPATAVPLVESGTGAVGTAASYAREDHVHPAAAAAAIPMVIGFVQNDGSTGTNVGATLVASRAGTVSKCKLGVKSSDPATDLTFTIKQNGTAVFLTSNTVAHATAGSTVASFTNLTSTPLAVAADDVFTLDISSGTSAWKFTVQLE